MTSDLFHDVARAYYGVSPELYTLARIATNRAAPPKYAMGCEAGERDQYSWHAPPLSSVADRPPDLDTVGSHLEALHDRIAGLSDLENGDEGHHWNMHDINLTLAHAAHFAGRDKIAKKYEERANAHRAAVMGGKSEESPSPKTKSTGRGYVSPGLPAPKPIQDTEGQKHFKFNFACNQPYALDEGGDTETESDDEEKPDFSETGTGDHVTADESDYSLPSDDISAPKAEEMLANPPRGKPLTGKQKRMLHAAANK